MKCVENIGEMFLLGATWDGPIEGLLPYMERVHGRIDRSLTVQDDMLVTYHGTKMAFITRDGYHGVVDSTNPPSIPISLDV